MKHIAAIQATPACAWTLSSEKVLQCSVQGIRTHFSQLDLEQTGPLEIQTKKNTSCGTR